MFSLRAFAFPFAAALALNALLLHAEEEKEKPAPAEKREKLAEDNPPNPNLKAVPKVIPKVAKAAVRGPNNPVGNIIILDGTKSEPANKNLTYEWSQISGENLRLRPDAMKHDRVGLRIYKAGKYKFQLVVSDGGSTSEPVEVELEVVDPDDK